jgi:hypothetical protein
VGTNAEIAVLNSSSKLAPSSSPDGGGVRLLPVAVADEAAPEAQATVAEKCLSGTINIDPQLLYGLSVFTVVAECRSVGKEIKTIRVPAEKHRLTGMEQHVVVALHPSYRNTGRAAITSGVIGIAAFGREY